MPHAQFPINKMPLQPTFSITIGSLQSTTDNPLISLQQISVERDLDIPADACTLKLLRRDRINLGQRVTVALGYEGIESTVFVGNVVMLRPTISGVEIRALGMMQKLLNLRTAATYENQAVGSIARDLIAQANLNSGNIDNVVTLPRYAIERRLSAFAHLKALANRLGYELYSDRHGLINFHVLDPATVNLPDVGNNYQFGQQLLTATAQRQPPAWGAVTVGGESPASSRGNSRVHWLTTNEATRTAGNGTPELLVLDPLARNQDLVSRFAAGRLAVVERKAHLVRLKVLGRPEIDLGDEINPSGLEEELINGKGYIRAIRHQFSDTAGFITEIAISRGSTS
jgi:phage protein D